MKIILNKTSIVSNVGNVPASYNLVDAYLCTGIPGDIVDIDDSTWVDGYQLEIEAKNFSNTNLGNWGFASIGGDYSASLKVGIGTSAGHALNFVYNPKRRANWKYLSDNQSFVAKVNKTTVFLNSDSASLNTDVTPVSFTEQFIRIYSSIATRAEYIGVKRVTVYDGSGNKVKEVKPAIDNLGNYCFYDSTNNKAYYSRHRSLIYKM